jgi:hypothetical protein
MDLSLEESSLLDSVTTSNLNFLNDYSLDKNEKYSFLKESLHIYFRSSPSPSKKLSIKKQTNFQTQLHSNLHNLLLQILYTKDPETQSKMIEKTYTWYLKRSGISSTTTPSMSSLTPKPSKSQNHEPKIFKHLKEKRKNQEFIFKSPFRYVPRKLSQKSRESLIEQIKNRHEKQIDQEKLVFFSPVKPILTKNLQNLQKLEKLNETNENHALDSSPSSKQKSIRTPEMQGDQFLESPLQSPSMDFRRVAHKFRMIKPAKIDREIDQVPFALAEEVAKVKKALSKQKMHVDAKTLENGLCVHQKVKLNTSSQKKLPMGGEMLLKYPVSTFFSPSKGKY